MIAQVAYPETSVTRRLGKSRVNNELLSQGERAEGPPLLCPCAPCGPQPGAKNHSVNQHISLLWLFDLRQGLFTSLGLCLHMWKMGLLNSHVERGTLGLFSALHAVSAVSPANSLLMVFPSIPGSEAEHLLLPRVCQEAGWQLLFCHRNACALVLQWPEQKAESRVLAGQSGPQSAFGITYWSQYCPLPFMSSCILWEGSRTCTLW